jgi:hypothetical protein
MAVKVLPQPPLVVVSVTVMTLVPHVSLAVGASNVHGVVHSTDLFVTQVMVGGVVSTTVTLWLQSA